MASMLWAWVGNYICSEGMKFQDRVNTQLNCRHDDTDHAVYILRIVTISMDEVQSLGFGLFGRFL